MKYLDINENTALFFFEDNDTLGRFKFITSDKDNNFEFNLRLSDSDMKKLVSFVMGVLNEVHE